MPLPSARGLSRKPSDGEINQDSEKLIGYCQKNEEGRSGLGLPYRSDVSQNTVIYGHPTSVEAKRPKDARVFERHLQWLPPTFLL
jgi:hypothetical protein